MLDFLEPRVRMKRDGSVEIVPNFIIEASKDIMIKGHNFYCIWDEDNHIWTTSEIKATRIIDRELKLFAKEKYPNVPVSIKYVRDTVDGSAELWKKYTTKYMPDNFCPLNNKIIFKSQDTKREDYSNVRVDYDLEEGEPESYIKLATTLFDEEELTKLEWAIGAILTGDSKKIQKFIVLYGDPGTGKSTYIDKIIKELFRGYYTEFSAKAVVNANEQFSMTPFKDNPLVGIQSDGDLSNISDTTKINSIVSHEEVIINEKHKQPYVMKMNTFLFLATNTPIDISSSTSGLNRRLLLVMPTGKKLSLDEYDELVEKIKFEKGMIANRCIHTYKRLGKGYYNKYVPKFMKYITDDFYNFIEDDYYTNIKSEDYVRSVDIWKRYKLYCDQNIIKHPYSYTKFRAELSSYFREFYKDNVVNGNHLRNVYKGFKLEKLGIYEEKEEVQPKTWIVLKKQKSLLDDILADCPSQYAKEDDTPSCAWRSVHTILKDIDTSKVHYILVPENHIVIDFDLKDEKGNKSLELNLAAASKWPKTYAEVSKGGNGLHLHYIYDGDVSMLRPVYEPGIEVKVYSGKSALRRRVSLCNDVEVSHILNGLPLKEKKEVINFEGFKSEKQLRKFINDCIDKKHHGATKPEIDFIFKALDDIYKSGDNYDVRDLRQKILLFAMSSSNQKDNCLKVFNRMKFCSDNYENENIRGEVGSTATDNEEAPIIFFDIEVFPNLLLICYKFEGDDKKCVRMFNPKPEEVEELFKYRLIGFNNRRYDNHIIYARSMGYSIPKCYKLSHSIIKAKEDGLNPFIGEAYNISYTDVYDFAATKMSLKKWEITLGIKHHELSYDWDKPLPEDKWEEAADYCCDDVIATEKVFNCEEVSGDFVARKILAELSGLSVNDTTNSHTIQIITGGDRNPNKDYIYTDLSKDFPGYIFNKNEKDTKKKSFYRGEYVGEGGYVYAEPGMYGNVPVCDVQSMHPTSIEMLNLFGPYTKNFSDIKRARIFIKHSDYAKAGELFSGKLKPYLNDPEMAGRLSYALKIAINSVYGLTSATFPNKLRDDRNIDNIVAKRGALFMIDLKHAVQDMGYKVIHIKTDSIKVANADEKIINFIFDYGKKWGYIFEIEDDYDRICLVNNAVYIAKYKKPKKDKKTGRDIWWSATGAEFAHPYIFKTLFSHENIEFDDLCETKQVKTNMYLMSDNGEMIFVGKVGSFVPMKNGHTLCKTGEDKEGNIKYDAVTGTKGYKWLEADYVKENHLESEIDYGYFDGLVEEAKQHISEFGDFDIFISNEPIPVMYEPLEEKEEELPFL